MEIEYQNTKADFLKFYKNLYITQAKNGSTGLIIFTLLMAFVSGGHPFNWLTSLIVFLITGLTLFSISFLIPFWRAVTKLNRIITKDPAILEKGILNTTETGLLLQTDKKSTVWNWETIEKFYSNEEYIFFELADNRFFLLSKKTFDSQDDVLNFSGIIQSGIYKARGADKTVSQQPVNKSERPPYLLGLLCLIPLIGAVVGLIFIVLSITRFKDKWFTMIGVFGILFTITLYSMLYYASKHAPFFSQGFAEISQMQLNSLVKNVEFYRLQHGQYPDSLPEILKDDQLAPINDASQFNQNPPKSYYNYEKVGEKYLLFSSGRDLTPNTKDDLYPQISISDSSKIGWIRAK